MRYLFTCLWSEPLDRRSNLIRNKIFFLKIVYLPEWSVEVVLTLSTTVRVDWVEFETTTGRCSLDTVTVLFIGGEDISTTLVIV